jgi:glycosyltransferase XagB
MKNISIIIPFSNTTIKIPQYVDWVNTALQSINNSGYQHVGDYEILFLTDSSDKVNLADIEIYPRQAPVTIHFEKEQKGLNNLILKGLSMAKYEFIGILDISTPNPSAVLKNCILEAGRGADVITAYKTTPKKPKKNKNIQSAEFSSITNRFLFELRKNPQSGAIFFRKNVWDTISFKSSESIFTMEFLIRAQEAGFNLKIYNIYHDDISQTEKMKFSFKKTFGAMKDVLAFKLKEIPPIHIPSIDDTTMVNAGVRYKKNKYVTHTTLDSKQSAIEVFGLKRLIIFGIFLEILAIGFVINPILSVQIAIAALSIIYLFDVTFNVYLVFKTMHSSSELKFTPEELQKLKDKNLPMYSILCPLYKEAHMLPQFLDGIAKLKWPKQKLDVLLLLEEDDTQSIDELKKMDLPNFIRTIVVPHSLPKTKPKACNYGLAFAKGQYTVIYDAEDIPDPWQLKKAYLAFKRAGRKIICLQAKLSYYNIHQNLLTRFFTAEYALWFGMTLNGLNSLNTTIPLGGTSNHFRTSNLKKLYGWDPFNVTEDADLGMRLFRLGYQTAILDSVTLEEGNSNVANWIRQRSRWIKGYMQTYLVHTRDNMNFIKERGIHALFFHLVIGGKIAFIFINPLLWTVTILYFIMYASIGAFVDTFYPQPVLYIAITSLIFGNYLYLFCHIMGCIKSGQWGLIKYIYLIPVYWILISIAGAVALYQLLFKPFYWEKTVHGLHMKKKLTDDLTLIKPTV